MFLFVVLIVRVLTVVTGVVLRPASLLGTMTVVMNVPLVRAMDLLLAIAVLMLRTAGLLAVLQRALLL